MRKLNVLVAGCGTGQHAITTATKYENSFVTAIDLSAQSLCYAKRKAQEYGIKNVNFIEMDILDLKKLNRKFGLIECSGVLHHMKDPIKGLSNLSDCLESNGYLKLGLYSKYAREKILKARKIIREKDIAWIVPIPNHQSWTKHQILSCCPEYRTQLKEVLCY